MKIKFWIPALHAVMTLALSVQAFAGTITGTVKFDGTAPNPKTVHMDADPVCYTVNKGNVKTPALLLGNGNTLGDVFVYIKGNVPWPMIDQLMTEPVITQAGCNYSPHVIGVLAGQKVRFLNPDGTMHNVHIMSKVNPEQNLAMPDFRKEMELSFAK